MHTHLVVTRLGREMNLVRPEFGLHHGSSALRWMECGWGLGWIRTSERRKEQLIRSAVQTPKNARCHSNTSDLHSCPPQFIDRLLHREVTKQL